MARVSGRWPGQLRRWACTSYVRRVIRKIIRSRRVYLTWGFVWLAMLVPLIATFVYMSIHEGDASKPYIPELRKIADQTPLYPGCQRTGENVVLKQDMAYFFTNYQCDAQFADISAFYARVLSQQGWTPPKRKNSIVYDMNDDHYQRGDYFVAVEQDGERSNSYSIVFIWAP